MSDPVNHPAHYGSLFERRDIECIAVTRTLNFDLGNYFKYLWRLYRKGGQDKAREDFEKALWYFNDWISHTKPVEPTLMCVGANTTWSELRDEDLYYKNPYAEAASIAFEFIQKPNTDGELADRYKLLSLVTEPFIFPAYWEELFEAYKDEYIGDPQ